jgi:hypothetical protein
MSESRGRQVLFVILKSCLFQDRKVDNNFIESLMLSIFKLNGRQESMTALDCCLHLGHKIDKNLWRSLIVVYIRVWK